MRSKQEQEKTLDKGTLINEKQKGADLSDEDR